MDGGLLLATQLSSLFPPSQITSIPLQTLQQNTPLPPPQDVSGPLAEHASFSSLFHAPTTGTILLRVLHGGLILELLSLSTDHQPIRFVFPAPILPSPAIFLWRSSELHVLVVTTTGSLYRLVLPIGGVNQLWHDPLSGNWCREYLINYAAGSMEGLVRVLGTHSVAIGQSNGSLLRLETEYLGDDNHNDEWTESLFQLGSLLHQLSSFLPTLASSASNGSEIISMTSHPWPTDVNDVWTLSRDRTLRLWKAKIGCVASKTLSLKIPGQGSTPPVQPSGNDSKPRVLLETGQQTLLRVFTTLSLEEHVYLLTFNPTPSSSASAGIFHLFDTFGDQFHEIRTVECSRSSAHCRLQDFIITNNMLYVLWDRQGQSAVEKTSLDPEELHEDPDVVSWATASYASDSELTPAYLEELFLVPGSLADKFCEAMMRPGIFSALTLRTAIDQYTDACLALPGPPPPQLTTAYGTLAENIMAVVGCTVNLVRDPLTGALQYGKYWNALRRDWKGFVARCRGIERSARWPLAIDVAEDTGDIILVERERVGALVSEDLALRVHRHLASGAQVDSHNAVLDISWMLRTRLGPRWMLNMEGGLFDILHQEIAFSFADILQDQVRRSNFREELDDGLENWILGRLHGITHIDQSIRGALDIVGGFDMEIKREEDEVALLIPPPQSEWWKSMISAYIMTSVEARYELCLSMFTLLFFLSDDLVRWDPSLLAEVFAVFRGIAMLRFVSRQPAGDRNWLRSHPGDVISPDDVAASLRNMHVSAKRDQFTPAYSLIHRLLPPSGDPRALPGVAHRFLDDTGLLQSSSPAQATKSEILFCEKFRLLDHYDVTRELLAWLPRTSGVIYVQARLWLAMGRADDASYLLEKLAGSFGPNSALTREDQETLAVVLPDAELCDSEFSFYLHSAALFKSIWAVHHEVSFSQLALSVAPQGIDVTAVWYTIIKGNADLGLYDDAYASLVATPYDQQKRECVNYLVYRMCEDDAVEKLMTFNFAGFADDVEDALSFKARHVDPRIRPFYSRILYSWYVFRGDYRNAALTMYQRAQKLKDPIGDPSLIVSLGEEQLEAYLVAMNALSLLDQKNAWIVMPVYGETGRESYKRRKLSRSIPEDQYMSGKQDAEVVELTDIQYQYTLLVAQLELIRKDPTLLSSPEPLLPPSSVVLRLAHSNRYNLAMSTARSLKVDMTNLFAQLTGQCLRLSQNPDAIEDDSCDWLLTDNVSSWPGSPADRGWRYLRQSLEQYDSAETDYKYAKVTLETILSLQQSPLLPPWLVHSLEENHPEDLIRTFLRFEDTESALEQTLSLMRRTEGKIARDPPKTACSTWLPYTLIDQVLAATTARSDLPPRGEKLRQELETELANWVKRMQKLSQFSR